MKNPLNERRLKIARVHIIQTHTMDIVWHLVDYRLFVFIYVFVFLPLLTMFYCTSVGWWMLLHHERCSLVTVCVPVPARCDPTLCLSVHLSSHAGLLLADPHPSRDAGSFKGSVQPNYTENMTFTPQTGTEQVCDSGDADALVTTT